MTDQIVRLGPEYFPDPATGRPIASGSVYIGDPDTDPEIVGNQITVNALQENGSTVPISQPILTSAGGMPLYNGSTVTLLVAESYSLKVLYNNDVQAYYVPSVTVPGGVTNTNVESIGDILELINIASPVDNQTRAVLSFFEGLALGGDVFYWNSSADKATANGGAIIDPDNIGGFDGTTLTLSGYFSAQGTGVGFGCWIRTEKEEMFTTEFGVVADGTTNDSTAWKGAVAAVSSGGLLIHPSTGDYSSIDTSEGLTSAIEIDHPMTIQINGSVKATFSAIQANPTYIFNATANDVTFTGSGWVEGDGTIDEINEGDDTTIPGLIRVTGDRFTSNVEIRIPPKVGIMLYDCDDANISDGEYSGGNDDSHVQDETAYFYIRVFHGNNHKIHNNFFRPDDTGTGGGRAVSAVFTNGTTGLSFVGNVGIKMHEKILYHNGDESHIVGNSMFDMDHTDSIRIVGSNNTVRANTGMRVKGGITCYDGHGNTISDNVFRDVEQTGIVVGRLSGSYTDGFNNTTVTGNRVYGRSGSVILADGIRIIVDGATAVGVEYSNNTAVGFATLAPNAGIRIEAISPYTVTANVEGNRTDNAYSGYRLTRMLNGTFTNNTHRGSDAAGYGVLVSGSVGVDIRGNRFDDPGLNGVAFIGSSGNCAVFNNTTRGATNIGISGYAVTGHSYGGNTYDDTPLVAVATVTNVITYTVTHGGVAPEAYIQLQTYNDAAGIVIVTKGYPTPDAVSPNFTIKAANGTAWNGGEDFLYNIIQ